MMAFRISDRRTPLFRPEWCEDGVMEVTSADGTNVTVIEEGNGRPILIVHPGGAHRHRGCASHGCWPTGFVYFASIVVLTELRASLIRRRPWRTR
jgi:hypothetical protein